MAYETIHLVGGQKSKIIIQINFRNPQGWAFSSNIGYHTITAWLLGKNIWVSCTMQEKYVLRNPQGWTYSITISYHTLMVWMPGANLPDIIYLNNSSIICPLIIQFKLVEVIVSLEL